MRAFQTVGNIPKKISPLIQVFLVAFYKFLLYRSPYQAQQQPTPAGAGGDEGMETALVLRTCNADMSSRNGFVWPESGEVVCPDWDPKPECGHGLHGLLDGNGNYSLLSSAADAKWLVVEVVRSECVDIYGKVKFPRGTVVYCGDMAGAMTRISDWWIKRALAESPDGDRVQAASGHYSQLAASGDYSRFAASGDYSRFAASGDDSRFAASGYGSQLAALGYGSRFAASGDYSRFAASGDGSRFAASGDGSQLAALGYGSRLAASGDYSRFAASGKNSIVMGAYNSTASAADGGAIALAWWDDDAKRPRVSVAYVGENGIRPNVAYRLNDRGEFVEA